MKRRVVAQGAHALFALTDALQGQAETGGHDPVHDRPHEDKHHEYEIVELPILAEKLRPGDAADSVLRACHGRPAVGDPPDDHAFGQGHHQKINPCSANGDQGERGGQSGGCGNRQGDDRKHGNSRFGEQVADHIGGGAEDAGVTERYESGETGQDVDAHGEEAVDHHFTDHVHVKGRREPGHETCKHKQCEHGNQLDPSARCHCTLPKRPLGLKASMIAMGPKMVK